MNHGLKVNNKTLEIALPDGIDIEKVVVNGEVLGEEQNVPDINVGDMISRQKVIDTEGLDKQIRCEMCRNPMHTDRGCDGNCKYDEKLYERIMQILGERIKPLPSAQQDVAEKLHQCKCYITDKKGLQHEVIYIDDIRRVTGWTI